VIGVDRQPAGIRDTNIWMSSRTRLCQKVFYPASEPQGLLSCLLALGTSLPKPGILIPSGDSELLCISRNRDVLSKYFRFRVPDTDTVELLADKARFYSFCKKAGIPAPLTFVDPLPDNISKIAGEIEYPCLIKPYLRGKTWNEDFDNKKVLIANNADELVQLFRDVYINHPEILIQEIVPGPDSNLYFSHVYLSEELETLAIWTGRKIRQRPIHFGTSTMTETAWVETVAEDSLEILRQLKCVGYASIEFKKDPRDGQYKVMEVTQGRTWYPHYLGFGAGINIPFIWYQDLLGNSQSDTTRAEEGIRWIDECRDPAASYDYWKCGELTFLDWVRSYRRVSISAFASLRDPSPLIFAGLRFLFEVPRSLIRKIKRLISK